MKNLMKKSFYPAVLAVAALIFAACGSSEKAASEKVTEPTGDKTAVEKSKKDDFPPAPDGIVKSDLRALEGENFKIGDFKGDVVLVNLWATWCAPCIKEMPHLIALQEKYGEKGFRVVGLNTDDESVEDVKAFVEKQNLNYKIGWANEDVQKDFYGITELPGIPQSIIINRNGNMTGVFRGGGPEVIEKMIETVDKTMAE